MSASLTISEPPTVWVGGIPRVWIGCLRCLNDGALIGHWFDAIDADTVSIDDVHRGSGRDASLCEELWVMDHEGIPVSGEMSPSQAAETGPDDATTSELIDGVSDDEMPALVEALTAQTESGLYWGTRSDNPQSYEVAYTFVLEYGSALEANMLPKDRTFDPSDGGIVTVKEPGTITVEPVTASGRLDSRLTSDADTQKLFAAISAQPGDESEVGSLAPFGLLSVALGGIAIWFALGLKSDLLHAASMQKHVENV